MKTAFQFGLAFVLIPFIDYFWLAKLMTKFYLTELGPLARQEAGVFKPMIVPAIGVYLAIALGIVVLVLPRAQGQLGMAALYGAVIGLSIYGVYDLTNLSLVANWPLRMSFVDIAWGTFLCGLVALLVELATQRVFPE